MNETTPRTSYFDFGKKIIRVDLSAPGYWVDIQPVLPAKEMLALTDRKEASLGKKDIVRQLLLVIKDWNICDEDGQVIPINGQTVEMLNTADLSLITGIIGRINRGPTQDESDGFLHDLQDTSETEPTPRLVPSILSPSAFSGIRSD